MTSEVLCSVVVKCSVGGVAVCWRRGNSQKSEAQINGSFVCASTRSFLDLIPRMAKWYGKVLEPKKEVIVEFF